MLFYVWLRVETGLVSAELRELKLKENRLTAENEELRADVARLSSFERIQRIAQEELGLVFLPRKDVIELAKE
jgi:cell division protein FtsL